MNRFRINKKQLLLGILFLLAGTTEYLVSRPIGSTHFLHQYDSVQLFFHQMPSLYGKLGMFAPEFFHPLAFSLMSAALIASKKSKIMLCIAWFSINLLFELGQTFGAELVDYLPQSFMIVPMIKGFVDFLVYGTFDIYDLLAIGLGSMTAFSIVLHDSKKEKSYEKQLSKKHVFKRRTLEHS